MRILHISPSYYPAFKYGGPIHSIHLLNKALVSKGVRIDVVTTNAGLDNINDIVLNQWDSVDRVRVKRLRYSGYEHYNFSPQLLRETMSIKTYDLAHITSTWNFPVLAGSLACMLWGRPYIISPRGALSDEAIHLRTANLKRIYFSMIAKQYLKKAAAVHFTTVDEQTRSHHLLTNSKSFVVPNGIDLSEYADIGNEYIPDILKELRGKKAILFLGRLNPIKGLDILVEAFKRIADEYQDVLLIMAGPDSDGYGATVKGWLIDAGILARVIFTGMIRGKDKLSIIKHSSLLILPSYSENFGMSAVEAMACGVPIVISNKVGIYREVEENRAGVIVETTPGSLYHGIKVLLDNEAFKEELAANGKKMVAEYYDIDKVADKMIGVYEGLIKNAKQRTS